MRSRIHCDAPGLRFICRESLDYGRSHFDHPLGSRFDEIDSVVVFDDVHVPFERCFLLGHPDLCNAIYTDTTAAAHMTHQVATRTIAKTEAMLGLVTLLGEAIGIDQFQHIQEDIAELIVTLEIVRGARSRRRGGRGTQRVRRADAEDGARSTPAATGSRRPRSASRRSCASSARAA